MKKMLILLAVATIPAALSGCAACCPTGLCPCCPCNWFAPEPYCPPAPVYAAPLAANPCAPNPCAPQMMPQMLPQYVSPMAAPSPCATCGPSQGMVMPQQMQPMFFQGQPSYAQAQPSYYTEPSCGCGYVESSCGMPSMVSYGPFMDYGPGGFGQCSGGGCDGGAFNAPAPEAFVDPRPVAE